MAHSVAPDRLMRVEEVAERLGLKQATVRQRILRREWPYVKIGRSVRLKESFINRLIEVSIVLPANGKRKKC